MTKKFVAGFIGMLGGGLLFLSACSQTIGGDDMGSPEDLSTPPVYDMAMAPTLKGSCDLRKNSPASQECRDYESSSTQFIGTYKGTCAVAAWTSDALCNRTGSLGGCRTNIPNLGGGTLTQWYFSQSGIMTQADVQAKCAAAGNMFVPP